MRFLTTLSVASLVMLTFTGALWPSPAAADDSPAVMVKTESENCRGELSDEFIRELQFRTSAKFTSPNEDVGDLSYVLTLESGDDESCEVRLENSDDGWVLVVDKDATRPQIASAANRVAWILDGTEVPEPDISASQSTLQEVSVEDVSQGSEEAVMRHFAADATGGALWIPAAEGAVPVARVRTSWTPRTNFRLGLTGRIPMRPLIVSGDEVIHTYRPWAISLKAGHVRQLSEQWSLDVGGGVRKVIPDVSTTFTATSTDEAEPSNDVPQQQSPDNGTGFSDDWREDEERESSGDVRHDDEAREARRGQASSDPDSSTPEALWSWAAVTYGSLRYAFAPDLALRLDAGLAISPTHRTIEDERSVIMNLGRMEVDIMLGLDVRF